MDEAEALLSATRAEKGTHSGHCAGCVLQMMGAQELWFPAALYLLLCRGVGVRFSQADSDGSFKSRLRESALHGKDTGWETVERFLETANVTSRVLREGKRCWENSRVPK